MWSVFDVGSLVLSRQVHLSVVQQYAALLQYSFHSIDSCQYTVAFLIFHGFVICELILSVAVIVFRLQTVFRN